jgi:dipeptidyl aminopeptidase/acylaminoacyl peptidase
VGQRLGHYKVLSVIGIYIKVIGVGEPLRLTAAPEEDLCPAWAPDGKYIAFLRFYGGELRGRHELYLIPPLGGKERKLADAAYSGVA